MIDIKATVKGEPDVRPFTSVLRYSSDDEIIFFSSVAMIEEKLQRGMRVNTNEALVIYCAHVVRSIRAGWSNAKIVKHGSNMLGVDSVMIGVPETLRDITFHARIDRKRAKIIRLVEPIPTSSYVMAG
jgi:urease gamma subunit